MAKLDSWFAFLGTIGDLSFYKMKGVDKTIVRKKGGHSKEKIKTADEFANTRRANAEFGGRSSAIKCITHVLGNQKAMVSFKSYGALNSLLCPIQKMDAAHEKGERSILISENPEILRGFNLTEPDTFDSIVKNPCLFTTSREGGAAKITIPALVPGINFSVPVEHPMFRFTAQLGVLPDLFYTENGYQPFTPFYKLLFPVSSETAWYPCIAGSPSLTLEMELPGPVPAESCSLMVSVAISFGVVGNGNNIFQQKRSGAVKILAVAG